MDLATFSYLFIGNHPYRQLSSRPVTIALSCRSTLYRSWVRVQKRCQQPSIYGNLWRDKQLHDYRKANNLCYSCGGKYEPGHAEVCAKCNNPQLHAMLVNDLDREIPKELLNAMAVDEMLIKTFCQLSLNAIADT